MANKNRYEGKIIFVPPIVPWESEPKPVVLPNPLALPEEVVEESEDLLLPDTYAVMNPCGLTLNGKHYKQGETDIRDDHLRTIIEMDSPWRK